VTPWMSPELLDPESFGLKKSRPTKESDCYALGMVIYEILSGRAPFAPSKTPNLEVQRGERPERPQGAQGVWFTDGIWGMLELCWKPQPGDRPSLNTVLRCLQDVTNTSSGMGGSIETDADDQSDATAASDSSMLSLFHLISQAHLQPSSWHQGLSITHPTIPTPSALSVPPPRVTSNRYRGITGLPTTPDDNGLPVPPLGFPPSVTSLMIPRDGGQPRDPPRKVNPKEGRVGERLARSARKIFKNTTRKLHGF